MKFQPPSLAEVTAHMLERNNGIDPVAFWSFYETNGWVQGKACKPIKNWKACVITWETTNKKAQKAGRQTIMQNLTDRSWCD